MTTAEEILERMANFDGSHHKKSRRETSDPAVSISRLFFFPPELLFKIVDHLDLPALKNLFVALSLDISAHRLPKPPLSIQNSPLSTLVKSLVFQNVHLVLLNDDIGGMTAGPFHVIESKGSDHSVHSSCYTHSNSIITINTNSNNTNNAINNNIDEQERFIGDPDIDHFHEEVDRFPTEVEPTASTNSLCDPFSNSHGHRFVSQYGPRFETTAVHYRHISELMPYCGFIRCLTIECGDGLRGILIADHDSHNGSSYSSSASSASSTPSSASSSVSSSSLMSSFLSAEDIAPSYFSSPESSNNSSNVKLSSDSANRDAEMGQRWRQLAETKMEEEKVASAVLGLFARCENCVTLKVPCYGATRILGENIATILGPSREHYIERGNEFLQDIARWGNWRHDSEVNAVDSDETAGSIVCEIESALYDSVFSKVEHLITCFDLRIISKCKNLKTLEVFGDENTRYNNNLDFTDINSRYFATLDPDNQGGKHVHFAIAACLPSLRYLKLSKCDLEDLFYVSNRASELSIILDQESSDANDDMSSNGYISVNLRRPNSVDISNEKPLPKSLASLFSYPQLEKLIILRKSCADISFVDYFNAPKLKHLFLPRSSIFERGNNNPFNIFDKNNPDSSSFKELESLRLNGRFIDTIPFGNLGIGFSEETYRSSIPSPSPSFWQYLPKLRFLDLGNNGISRLGDVQLAESGSSASNSFESLEYLILAHNFIGDFDVRTVAKMPKLKVLDMSRNIISEIPQRLDKLMPRLQELRFVNNQIKVIENLDSRGHGMRWLKKLNLSKNKMTLIDIRCSMPALEVLDLSYNSIEQVNNNEETGLSRRKLPNLQVFNLAHNRIESIEGVACLAGSLKVLDLADNRINCIKPLVFLSKTLEKLVLSNNHRINDFEPLTQLTSLRELSAADCKMSCVPIFSQCRQLQYLDLSRNRLLNHPASNYFVNLVCNREYSSKANNRRFAKVFEVPSVKILILNNCSPTSLLLIGWMFPNLHCLHLKSSSIGDDVFVNNLMPLLATLQNLQDFSLAKNQISSLKIFSGKNMGFMPNSLLKLDLSQNKIEQLIGYEAMVNKLQKLEWLSIRENRLSVPLLDLKSFAIYKKYGMLFGNQQEPGINAFVKDQKVCPAAYTLAEQISLSYKSTGMPLNPTFICGHVGGQGNGITEKPITGYNDVMHWYFQ